MAHFASGQDTDGARCLGPMGGTGVDGPARTPTGPDVRPGHRGGTAREILMSWADIFITRGNGRFMVVWG